MTNQHTYDVENKQWSNHLKNKPYFGSQDSAANETSVNIPSPFESFILGPDEKKVEEKIDTRKVESNQGCHIFDNFTGMPNTSIFKFNKEDHTLGNLLRDKLLKNSHVVFSAYRVPHPLFPTFELRVQTDGEITPKQAVLATCRELVSELNNLQQNFKTEYTLRKLVKEGENAQQ